MQFMRITNYIIHDPPPLGKGKSLGINGRGKFLFDSTI